MVYFGNVINGRIELEQPIGLPEGTRVRIERVDQPKVIAPDDPAYRLYELAGEDPPPADGAAPQGQSPPRAPTAR